MSNTRICLIRHGEIAWNAEGRVQGRIDMPLNELGRAQAEATSEALATARWPCWRRYSTR